MNTSRHPATGCVDGFLPISPIDRRPSVHPCPLCREEGDFSLSDEGTIILLRPVSDAAREWVVEHIGDETNGYQPFWPTVVIERRYVADIIEGIVADALTIKKEE